LHCGGIGLRLRHTGSRQEHEGCRCNACSKGVGKLCVHKFFVK
jgi:hypothetical protein